MIYKDAVIEDIKAQTAELEREIEFIKSLTPDQKEAYNAGRESERRARRKGKIDEDSRIKEEKAELDDLVENLAQLLDRRPAQNNVTAAQLFLRFHGEKLYFASDLRRWLHYNGKVWETDNGENTAVRKLLIDFNKLIIEAAEKIGNQARGETEEKKARKLYSWATGLNNRPALDNVLSIVSTLSAVSMLDFDINDTVLNVANGTVDLTTGELKPHDPADKLTIISQTDYKPDAVYEKWDNFLLESCGRKEYVRYLQKELGYSITGLTDDESIFLLYGDSGTGKSTFYEPIKDVIGDYARYMSFNTLKSNDKDSGGRPREDLLRLRTCRTVICSEINKGTTFDTALLKKIASGENLVSRGIHAKDSVEYAPKFKIVIGTNYPPIIPFDDEGSYRRFKVNPFNHKPDQVDKKLKRAFKTEKEAKEAILAWLVKGSVYYFREGLDDLPREVERALTEYKRQQNPLYLFIEDHCIEDSEAGTLDEDGKRKRRDLTTVKRFVETFNHHKAEYGVFEDKTNKGFGRLMSALNYERWHEEKERGYIGIRVKTQKEIDEDLDFYDIRNSREALKALEKGQICRLTSDIYNTTFTLLQYRKLNDNSIKGYTTTQTSNVSATTPDTSTFEREEKPSLSTIASHIRETLEGLDGRGKADREILLSGLARDLEIKLKLESEYADRIVEKLAKEDPVIIGLIARISGR